MGQRIISILNCSAPPREGEEAANKERGSQRAKYSSTSLSPQLKGDYPFREPWSSGPEAHVRRHRPTCIFLFLSSSFSTKLEFLPQ